MSLSKFSKNRNEKKAFTLVELLVVIAIIGVLVALLLPAVQAAREAARRSACTNNLRQLALGVVNHVDARGHFPTQHGWSRPSQDDVPPGSKTSGVSWILNLLPYIEQSSLHAQFKLAGVYEGQFNNCTQTGPDRGLSSSNGGLLGTDLVQTQLPVLQCPSDESASQLPTDRLQWETCPVAVTSYTGVLGDSWTGQEHSAGFSNDDTPYPSGNYGDEKPRHKLFLKPGTDRDCHRDHRCRGFFYRNTWAHPVELKSVTDGTSNTFMIGENIPELNRGSAAYYANSTSASCNTPLNSGLQVLKQGDSAIATFIQNWWEGSGGFKSKHPQGVHFAKVDGSVRFVAEDADNVAFRTSCTRNGGEFVSSSL